MSIIWSKTSTRPVSTSFYIALVSVSSFALYWASSFILEWHHATEYFGADTRFYALLAQGNVFEQLPRSYELARAARFHPVTLALAAIWMNVLSPLTLWIEPLHLLKAMFAAVGAIGAGAATSAFARLVPRGDAALWGFIYAVSFGVWYFASIEESKIVTATLSALYITVYLQMREHWTATRVGLLTAIFLAACLNEIVSGFLLIIPLLDTFLSGKRDWRSYRWIAAQAVIAPAALVILEFGINGSFGSATVGPESRSHFSMLFYYVASSDHSASSLYSFVLNWFFFNIVAPASNAPHAVALWPNYTAFFEPGLVNYLFSPLSAGAITLICVMVVAGLRPRQCGNTVGEKSGILIALAAFVLLRGSFFFVFNPAEPLLFSPAVTLPLMLCICMRFMASDWPNKQMLLAATAVLLLLSSGAFIVWAPPLVSGGP